MDDLDETTKAIEAVTALVDSYHGMHHPAELAALWLLQREMVAARTRLARRVKPSYGNKALTYLYRKYNVAREIVAAMDRDAKEVGTKKRAMNVLEVQTEALDMVLQLKKQHSMAEALYEEVVEVLKSADKALWAIGQEVQDGMKERDYHNACDLINRKSQQQ